MKKIRIAFFDIDGTLVTFGRRTLTEAMTGTLLALQKRGIRIVIATGRPLIRVPQYAGVHFDAFLAFNGSCLADRDRHIFSRRPIPKKDVLRILDNTKALHHPIVVSGETDMLANGTEPDLDEYFRLSGQVVPERADFGDYVQREPIYQMMAAVRRPEYDAVLEGAAGAAIAAWWDRAVDIIPKKSGKDTGVREICRYFHLSPEEAIAFGDGGNDVPMLQAVGTGVAMGNAGDAVKAAVRYQCPSVQDEGITVFCREHGLI